MLCSVAGFTHTLPPLILISAARGFSPPSWTHESQAFRCLTKNRASCCCTGPSIAGLFLRVFSLSPFAAEQQPLKTAAASKQSSLPLFLPRGPQNRLAREGGFTKQINQQRSKRANFADSLRPTICCGPRNQRTLQSAASSREQVNSVLRHLRLPLTLLVLLLVQLLVQQRRQ